ncbi:BgTH12-03878 [Blumeria graminis f. sp. triticale]|uniref:Bgt-51066 n=2 Tax=Blumeria graminis TaxID=34373 RepID=A0A9X9L9T7_BLUGR|nr:BgTH12-03878 [Blumeria graminis f. sp. triticale]VCU39939.1 Bgt-51066 [Blumeria graminis f. sp. tritici]
MVLNSEGIMGGVVLEIEDYRKELKYYPCLPWDEKYESLPSSLFEHRLVENLATYE